mmetsp:Transcript_8331/g.9526  ORF Transcript_8331/g.9526 Transcript_8331/m.9526 type:complete len:459 (+) Transcript_8331:1-1377(+)
MTEAEKDMSKRPNSMLIVLKIGTSSLLIEEEVPSLDNNDSPSTETRLNIKQMANVVEVIYQLKLQGHAVILVSSGAVGAGCHVLNEKKRPTSLAQRQALAAIGQIHLMGKYDNMFNALKLKCAQVLITYDTFKSKDQYFNAGNTFRALLKMGVTPIVNENDTVATAALQSDNDTLAAMVGSLVGADSLVLLTDVDGVFTDNPNKNPDAKLIRRVSNIQELEQMINTSGGEGSTWGTGGMAAKVNAARLATSMGIETTIMRANNVSQIVGYASEAALSSQKSGTVERGTTFERVRAPPKKRKRWIRGLRAVGKIILDDGAVLALRKRKPIYAIGIVGCEGFFTIFSPVTLCSMDGQEIGKGLTNYNSHEIRKIMRKHTIEIIELELGRSGAVIDRKNLAVYFPRDDAIKNTPELKPLTSNLADLEAEIFNSDRSTGRFVYTNFDDNASDKDSDSQGNDD